MSNYEINIQVDIHPTEQDLTSDVTPSADGRFRIVVSRESAQSIDQCEQALLAVNYPAIREALARHLSAVCKEKAEGYGVGVVKKTSVPTPSTAK